jgi:exosortase F-associated protein
VKARSDSLRWFVGVCSVLGLAVVYLFQRTNVAAFLGIENHAVRFILNKTLRFLINDFLMIGLLYSLFPKRKYVIFALWVQLAGFVFILVPYLVIKLALQTGNGPLVSFLHRLTVNPILLLLLIPAFYYQQSKQR